MSLTWNDTVDLLKVITAKDRRTVGRSDIQFWHAVASRAEWPGLPFAIAAVIEHTNAAPGVWLEPGHITAYWTKIKSELSTRWSPPAPPEELIDDPEGSWRYVQDDYQTHLDQAVLAFAKTGTTPSAQLEAGQ